MFSVTQNGKPLSKSLYTWDEKTKVFGTKESNLVLDFSDYSGVTFNTGSYCTFNTDSGCTFEEVGEKCVLSYTWNNCFKVYTTEDLKLPCKILENGSLEVLIEKLMPDQLLEFIGNESGNPFELQKIT